MGRVFNVLLISTAILGGLLFSELATAGRKPPPDPLTQTLEQAGLKELDKEVVLRVGEAIEVGAPLRLGQRTAYPPTTIENFQPQLLDLTGQPQSMPPMPRSITCSSSTTRRNSKTPERWTHRSSDEASVCERKGEMVHG